MSSTTSETPVEPLRSEEEEFDAEVMKKELDEVARISALYIYPVKSASAIEVESAEFTPLGLKYGNVRDRSFVAVDIKRNVNITCSEIARMQRIVPTIVNPNEMWLDAPGKNTLKIYFDELLEGKNKSSQKFGVVDQEAYGVDCGDWAGNWFGSFLGKKNVRLFYYSDNLEPKHCKDNRRLLTLPNQKDTDITVYANYSPYMMASMSSLEDIQLRYKKWLGMKRFRPNIVIEGPPPYTEELWHHICINNEVWLRNVKPCDRCAVITIDPETGLRNKHFQPIKFLRSYRQSSDPEMRKFTGNSPLMGLNLMIDKTGKASVGDRVQVIHKS